MDLYPEVLLKNISKKDSYILDKIISPIFNIAYRSASKIVSLADSMSCKLEKKNVSKQKIDKLQKKLFKFFKRIKPNVIIPYSSQFVLKNANRKSNT